MAAAGHAAGRAECASWARSVLLIQAHKSIWCVTGAQAKWEVRTGFPQLISFSA